MNCSSWFLTVTCLAYGGLDYDRVPPAAPGAPPGIVQNQGSGYQDHPNAGVGIRRRFVEAAEVDAVPGPNGEHLGQQPQPTLGAQLDGGAYRIAIGGDADEDVEIRLYTKQAQPFDTCGIRLDFLVDRDSHLRQFVPEILKRIGVPLQPGGCPHSQGRRDPPGQVQGRPG